MSVKLSPFLVNLKCCATGYPHYCKCPAKWSHGSMFYCGRHDPDQIAKRTGNAARRATARREQREKRAAHIAKINATKKRKQVSAKRDIKALLQRIVNLRGIHAAPWSDIVNEAERLKGIFK